MEKFSRIESLSKIQDMALKASNNALPEKEYDKLYEQLVNMDFIKSDRKLNNFEYNQYSNISEKIAKATMSVQTLAEYRKVLEAAGLDFEDVNDTLSHENAHANKAEAIGAEHGKYVITFLKSEDGVKIAPRVQIVYPENWNKEELNKAEVAIRQAPEEYENTLSESDINQIDRLKKIRQT